MVTGTEQLERLEAELARTAYANLSYAEALARYSALWAYARTVRPSADADWLEDLAPDLAVARAVNGLPPVP